MGDIQSYENMTDFGKIRKIIVNYTVVIFGIIFILIFMLLGLYYLTPNNYIIEGWEKDKFKLENTIEYTISSGSNSLIVLNNTNYDKYLKFSEKANLIVKNYFKSQSIIVDGKLIKSKFNSEIFIINNTKDEKKIIIQFYSLI